MGWRGFLRSARAAERAAANDHHRRTNAVKKGHHSVDRILTELEAEIEQHLQTIRQLDHKIRDKPISASGIKYNPSSGTWFFKPLQNEFGKLNWTATVVLSSDKIRCGGPVQDRQRSYSLIAVTATQWAFFAAIQIVPTGIGGKSTKLFTKSDPTKNRVFLVSEGQRYQAIEGGLDIKPFGPEPAIALAAFPLPSGVAQDIHIAFMFDSGPARIDFACEKPLLFQEAERTSSLVDMVRTQLTAQTEGIRKQAEEAKENIRQQLQPQSGCAGVFVAIIAMVALWCFSLQ